MKTKTKNLLLDRLEKQAVEIAELTVKVAEEKARATKLRNWWDEETEKADRLDNQSQEQDKRIQELEANAAGLLGDAEAWREYLAAKPGYDPNPTDEQT